MNSKFGTLLVAIAFVVGASVTSSLAHDMDSMESDSGGSDTGATGQMGSHMKATEHMTMTEVRSATPADTTRGEVILAAMREKLAKYQDYKVAMTDGYEPYMEQIPQDVYHFSSRSATMAEYMGDFDLSRPGSLLYEKKTLGGYKLVGAMYDAPPGATPEQLDQLIPLGLTHWHAHTNICLPSGVTENDVTNGRVAGAANLRPDISSTSGMGRSTGRGAGTGLRMRFGYMADPRFGFNGTISEEAECQAVGGNFHKQIFGWMVHVYPFASDDLRMAFSTEAP